MTSNTPRDIVMKLHGSIVRALHDPLLRKRFISDGAEPMPSNVPEDFGGFIRSEIVKWARVVKTAGIQAE